MTNETSPPSSSPLASLPVLGEVIAQHLQRHGGESAPSGFASGLKFVCLLDPPEADAGNARAVIVTAPLIGNVLKLRLIAHRPSTARKCLAHPEHYLAHRAPDSPTQLAARHTWWDEAWVTLMLPSTANTEGAAPSEEVLLRVVSPNADDPLPMLRVLVEVAETLHTLSSGLFELTQSYALAVGSAKLLRAGDRVYHCPTREVWVLAGAEAKAQRIGSVYPMGWPETSARHEDCILIEAATDEEHVRTLREVATSNTYAASLAKHLLAKRELPTT